MGSGDLGMLKTTLGRLGSSIISPDRSLDLFVFLDAGGRPSGHRLWAGLAAVGERELARIEEDMEHLKQAYPDRLERDGELKGKNVPVEVAKKLGRKLHSSANRRSRFWVNWYPRHDDGTCQQLCQVLSDVLRTYRVNPSMRDSGRAEKWFVAKTRLFDDLKPTNRHKMLSILASIGWLCEEIKRVEIGPQMRSVRVCVDQENLPGMEDCAALVKGFTCACLQGVGMSVRLTGKVFRESHEEGAVAVRLDCDSARCPGLQYVDVLLQVVQDRVCPAQKQTG